MEKHVYEPCAHEGRHGYTLRGEPEYEFCERCRRGPEAHEGRTIATSEGVVIAKQRHVEIDR